MKVLIVEDEKPAYENLVEELQAIDESIAVMANCNSVDASVRWLNKNPQPDLILMDIQLPVMDGYETTRRIRANPDLKSIPIIAVTSYALAGDEAKALAAGCNAYVTKPYSPRHLLAKVREFLPS